MFNKNHRNQVRSCKIYIYIYVKPEHAHTVQTHPPTPKKESPFCRAFYMKESPTKKKKHVPFLWLRELIDTPVRSLRKPRFERAPANCSSLYEESASVCPPKKNWLVVSAHLKNISQNGNLPQIGVKIKNIWNHHLEKVKPASFLNASFFNTPPSNQSPL